MKPKLTIIKNTLIVILFLFGFTLTNCNSKRQKLFSDGNDAAQLIALLDNSTNLEDEYIGFNGTRSTSFEIYKRLGLFSSDTALIKLARHKNPKLEFTLCGL